MDISVSSLSGYVVSYATDDDSGDVFVLVHLEPNSAVQFLLDVLVRSVVAELTCEGVNV